MKKTNAILTATAAFLTIASAANAQTLQTYFNMNSYGTQSAGATITDTMGNTTATVNSLNTSLTSGGLAITAAGGAVGSTGVTLGSGSLNIYGAGAFSIQDWFTPTISTSGTSWAGQWGGSSTSASPGASTFLFGNLWGNAISTSGNGMQINPSTSLNTVGTLYDEVVTYDGAGSLKEYVNGTLLGSGTVSAGTFLTGGLAGLLNFSIGGVANSPFPDTTQTTTTSDFLMYTGALTQSQVTALNSAGAGASLNTLGGIVTVPEPSTFALAGLGATGLLLWRRQAGKGI